MTKGRPVTIAGVLYPSINAASKALGISRSVLADRLGDRNNLSEVPKFKPKCLAAMVPVEIRGRRYPSITAAASALGVTAQTVSRHLDAGTPDKIGKHPYSGRNQPNRYSSKKGQHVYPSEYGRQKGYTPVGDNPG